MKHLLFFFVFYSLQFFGIVAFTIEEDVLFLNSNDRYADVEKLESASVDVIAFEVKAMPSRGDRYIEGCASLIDCAFEKCTKATMFHLVCDRPSCFLKILKKMRARPKAFAFYCPSLSLKDFNRCQDFLNGLEYVDLSGVFLDGKSMQNFLKSHASHLFYLSLEWQCLANDDLKLLENANFPQEVKFFLKGNCFGDKALKRLETAYPQATIYADNQWGTKLLQRSQSLKRVFEQGF